MILLLNVSYKFCLIHVLLRYKSYTTLYFDFILDVLTSTFLRCFMTRVYKKEIQSEDKD